jgi:hypothetical protein
MVITVRNDMFDMSFTAGIDAVPWPSTFLNTRVHMVETQPRY